MSDVVILKTGRLHEADMLAQELEHLGVPHSRGMENFSGLRFAMPALPVQGPGTFFTVMVPEAAAGDARSVLNALPITPEVPRLWSYNPRPWAKNAFIFYAWVMLIGLALAAVFNLIEWITELY